MNNQPIQPLVWNVDLTSYTLEEHPLEGIYDRVFILIHELSECVGEGIRRWRDDLWEKKLARAIFSPALAIGTVWHELTDRPEWNDLDAVSNEWIDEEELSGYPANIRDAARGIFHGVRSSQQYRGYYSNFAEAIRANSSCDNGVLHERSQPEENKPARYVISDRYVYAMAAAVVAWRASSGLIRWLEESIEELDRLKCLEQANPSCNVAAWAYESPDEFEDWAEKYRLEWAISEADEREYAARCLGRAKRLLLLSEVADALDQATLDRLSLQEVEPIKQKAEKHSAKARAGGQKQLWGWAKPLWLAFAKDWWKRNPRHSAKQVCEEIIKRHDMDHVECFPITPADEASGAIHGRVPARSTVSDVIKDLQPSEHRSKAGRPKKATSTRP